MLKAVPNTKIVALGIGAAISVSELNYIASDPKDKNFIMVEDFAKLGEVKDQLRDVSCGQLFSAITTI